MSADRLRDLVAAWTAKGFQVNTHAIGDAANKMALDVYQATLQQTATTNKELRLRIEHAQIMVRNTAVFENRVLTPLHKCQEDIVRTGRLGIIASMQPTHATSDMDYAEARLGPERIKGAYAWQSLSR